MNTRTTTPTRRRAKLAMPPRDNVVIMAGWHASKNPPPPPMPSAKMYDLRPRLPARKAELAQRKNRAALIRQAASLPITGGRFGAQEIAYLAMVFKQEMEKRRS